MENYIWVGHREAELFKTNNFFSNSITSYLFLVCNSIQDFCKTKKHKSKEASSLLF